MYEAQRGEIVVAATGDSMIARPLAPFREDSFLALVDLLRGADAAFTNLEMQVHRFEPPPAAASGGIWTAADPDLLDDLKWAGITMVSCANNHCYDYGESGLLATLRNLERSGLAFSGIGRNLSDARAPVYVECPAGRVALLSCTSTFDPASPAGEQRHDLHGRPGVSALGWSAEHVVDSRAFNELRRLDEALGFAERRARQVEMGFGGGGGEYADRLRTLGHSFTRGDGFAVRTSPNDRDAESILRWVREARRQADWVFLSIHTHEAGATEGEPAEFVETFARSCVDEGADAVFGHGPHFLRGIEIYRNRPIFYSLGNLMFQNEVVPRLPTDLYDAVGLDSKATPADFYDFRSQDDTRGFTANAVYWESVVAELRLSRNSASEIVLYPIELGYGTPRSQRGRPVMAGSESAERTLRTAARLCDMYGTRVTVKEGVGVIELGALSREKLESVPDGSG